MKKVLFLLFTSVVIAFSAHAKTIDTSNLTAEQIATVQAQVAEMSKSSPQGASAAVRKEAEAWGELGSNMGKAMVGAAREVGVAANEFAATDLGKVTVAIIAYKLIGEEAMGVIVGMLVFVVGVGIALWILLTNRFHTIQYETKPILWGMLNKRYVVSSTISDDNASAKLVGIGVTMLITLVVSLMTIF